MSPLQPLLGLLGCPCPSMPTPAEFPGSKTLQGIAALNQSQSAAFQMLGQGLAQGHSARTRTGLLGTLQPSSLAVSLRDTDWLPKR